MWFDCTTVDTEHKFGSIHEVALPALWASYLINNDPSSLTEEDREEIEYIFQHLNEFLGSSFCDILSVHDCPFYGRFNGVGRDMLYYTVLAQVVPVS